MSSTNKTTYYELPQFVDNDIFNPLVDDNDAYAKIDTALHNIAEAETSHESDIVSVKSRLDSAEGDIDALEVASVSAADAGGIRSIDIIKRSLHIATADEYVAAGAKVARTTGCS